MQLLDYLKEHGTGTPSCPALAETAAKAECSEATLYQIALGHKPAGWKLAQKIEDATAGAVTRHDLRPEVFGPAPAAQEAA